MHECYISQEGLERMRSSGYKVIEYDMLNRRSIMQQIRTIGINFVNVPLSEIFNDYYQKLSEMVPPRLWEAGTDFKNLSYDLLSILHPDNLLL